MSDIDPQEFGELRADVRNLVMAVKDLAIKVEGMQRTGWTARGVWAGLTLAGGAAGGKLLALFGAAPPPGQP